MAGLITISARTAGSRRALFDDWSIALPPDDFGDDGLTLRDLIAKVVRFEVEAYETRRDAWRLDRVFSRGAIDAAAECGRVSPEGKNLPPASDAQAAVATAWQAFEDGLYLVVIDGREHRRLDGQVFLRPSSRVAFVRLIFLAGGP